MVQRIAVALIAFFLGYATFFSFVVAPVLFSVLPKSEAGQVVAKIFPLYFGGGISLMLVSALLTYKSGLRKIALLLGVGVLIFALQEFAILPLSETLKVENYEAFKTLHGISMFLNLVGILLALVSLGWLLKIDNCNGGQGAD